MQRFDIYFIQLYPMPTSCKTMVGVTARILTWAQSGYRTFPSLQRDSFSSFIPFHHTPALASTLRKN